MGMLTENLIRRTVNDVSGKLSAVVTELRQVNANLKAVIALLSERK